MCVLEILFFLAMIILSTEQKVNLDIGGMNMSKYLVAYFSASGVTESVAKLLAETTEADLYEIKPKTLYTEADLDWKNEKSRSSVEMNDLSARPEISDKVPAMEKYDVVFVGFPIWWYTAPRIINTFLESYDLTGKKIVPFATSGGSEFGKTNENLQPSCKEAVLYDGKVLNGEQTQSSVKQWVDSLDL